MVVSCMGFSRKGSSVQMVLTAVVSQEHLIAMGVAAYADLAGCHQPHPPFRALDTLSQTTMKKLAGNATGLQMLMLLSCRQLPSCRREIPA